ncbi:MAG: T9SS C-terminal target domain-containing protein [Bacteroidetes bacterium]|nr:MAG: T9SS C-terminal target domain-containing protein [Bacteroidota bacterium]
MKTIITITICIICGCFNSFAQQFSLDVSGGTIKGIVIDTKTKKILDYASLVLLKDKANHAMTLSDDEGNFVFKNLPEGSYTIKASYNGYTTSVIADIEVTSNATKQLKISLKANVGIECYTTCCFVRRREVTFDSSSIKAIEKFNYQNLQKNYAEEKDLQFPCLMQHKSRKIEAALKEQQIKLFNEMRVFPNPASHVLNIESMYDEKKIVNIYSIAGILVKSTTIVHHTQIEVNDLMEGVYIVQVIDEKNDEKLFQKIVVRH